MAAAEYFQQGPGPQQQQPPPQPQQQRPQQQPMLSPLPYPISDAPPPYSSIADHSRPHSQPPPQQRVSGPGPNGYAPPMNGHYPPEKNGVQNMYNANDFGGPASHQQPYPDQRPNYYGPPQQGPQQGGLYPPPSMQSVYGNGNDPNRRTSSTPGFYNGPPNATPQQFQPPLYRRASSRSRSRERARSRDREHGRHHHHHHHHNNNNGGGLRPTNGNTRKKSSGVATFIGAGGGAIIGDAIFPGLGTLGGMILGGVGGHEYGKQRKEYSGSGRAARPRSYSNSEVDYHDDYRRGRRY